jgi:hypothetical protein
MILAQNPVTCEPLCRPRGRAGGARPALLLAATLAVGMVGCNAFSVATPENFVSLKRYRTRLTYKAVAPDNAVLSVRSFAVKDRGTLAYWTEIVRREMVLRKGYILKSTVAVKAGNGVPGTLLLFDTQSGKRAYRYAVALFVTSAYVHAVEMAAKADRLDPHRSDLDKLIASLRPR